MARRGHGEGSIFKTQNGRWKVLLTVPAASGQKRRRIARNARTRADAFAILLKLQTEFSAGVYRDHTRQTVAEFLARWLDEHIRSHRAPATEALYRSICKDRIVPAIGSRLLQKLSAADIQSFVDGLARSNAPTRSSQLAFSILRKALRHAVKVRLIAIDPSDGIDKPRHDSSEINPFSREEVGAIFEATADSRYHALFVLAFSAGMRQGELFGMTWESVDLKSKTIRVSQAVSEVSGRLEIRSPKTKNAVRTIELTDFAVSALRDHRAVLMREGNAGSELVFPAVRGGLISRTRFRARYWVPLLKRLKIEPRGFHHTRHTYATLALGAGVPVHIVAKVLGHSRPSTTLNTYAHVLRNQQSAATDAMQKLFG